MRFIYRETEKGAEILRCLGIGGEVHIPERIGELPVTSLGPYVFSAHMREKPEGLSFEDGAPGGAAQEISGERLKELYLPPTVESVGRYAFYNCSSFRVLSFYTSVRDLGAGAFTGVTKMEALYVREVPGVRSCLKEVLSELNMELKVKLVEADGSCARLLFPQFYEEAVENTPARILETHMHGSGHRYRYCFKNTEFQFREYDKIFSYAKAEENPRTAARLALLRLMNPVRLDEKYAEEYRQYVVTHAGFIGEYLLKENLIKEFRFAASLWFGKGASGRGAETAPTAEGKAGRAHEGFLDLWQSAEASADMDKLLSTALRLKRSEAVSFLMELSRKMPGSPKKSFDLF